MKKKLVLKSNGEVKIARDLLLLHLTDIINKEGMLDWNSKVVSDSAFIFGLADDNNTYVQSLTYVMCELETRFTSEVSDDFEKIIFKK